MNVKRITGIAVTLTALACWSTMALADKNAYCEMVSHGDKVKKATGHCDYQDDGDRVQITLVNGDSYTLTRKEKKNKFKDQKGKNVNRTVRDKDKSHYYKWESKNITVFPEDWKS